MGKAILYFVLFSLMSAGLMQANAAQEMTSVLTTIDGRKYNVLDCAILIPSLDESLGPGRTDKLKELLEFKGYNPIVSPALKIEQYIQKDGSHQAIDYYTDRHMSRLKDNGVGTAYLALTGERVSIKKSHRFTLHLYRVGRETEIIGRSSQPGTLGQAELSADTLPSCQAKDL